MREKWGQGRMCIPGREAVGRGLQGGELGSKIQMKRRSRWLVGKLGEECSRPKSNVSRGAEVGCSLVCVVHGEEAHVVVGGRGARGRVLSHTVPWPGEGAYILF